MPYVEVYQGKAVNLRQTIERRLAALRMERRRIQARLSVVSEMEKEFEQVLAEADQMTLSPELNKAAAAVVKETVRISEILKEASEEESGNTRLKEFLINHLTTEGFDLESLVTGAISAGFNFGTKSPARVLHFNLLNLKNSGLVEKDGEKWKLKIRTA